MPIRATQCLLREGFITIGEVVSLMRLDKI